MGNAAECQHLQEEMRETEASARQIANITLEIEEKSKTGGI